MKNICDILNAQYAIFSFFSLKTICDVSIQVYLSLILCFLVILLYIFLPINYKYTYIFVKNASRQIRLEKRKRRL